MNSGIFLNILKCSNRQIKNEESKFDGNLKDKKSHYFSQEIRNNVFEKNSCAPANKKKNRHNRNNDPFMFSRENLSIRGCDSFGFSKLSHISFGKEHSKNKRREKASKEGHQEVLEYHVRDNCHETKE